MFMRIVWGRLKPGRWSAYEKAYKAATRDAAPGLLQRYLIRDVIQPDAGFSITVWETEADMMSYERDETRRDRTLAPMREFFTGEFNVQRCMVAHAVPDRWPGHA